MGRFLRENPLFTVGAALLLALALFGVVGSYILDAKNIRMGAVPMSLRPSAKYPLGTEGYGRDVLTLLVFGIPNTLKIGLLAGGVGVLAGAILGLLAGYYRTFLDTLLRSASDVMLVIPALAILITVAALVRVVTVEMMALIVGALAWALPARVVRAQTLSIRERAFVDVARLSGMGDMKIIFVEILPNLIPYLAAAFVGSVNSGILAAIGLQVLGLGPALIPTTGRTLYDAFERSAMFRGLWWWWASPVAILALIFAGLFLISISLDKYANPRLRGISGR